MNQSLRPNAIIYIGNPNLGCTRRAPHVSPSSSSASGGERTQGSASV
jgi:hypothetical protein